MRGKQPHFRILFSLLAFMAASAPKSEVSAEDSVPGQVLVVLASEQAGDIDPELAQISALRKPPFSSFRSMKVLTRTDIVLKPGQPFTVSLPNGRHLMLTLTERMPDGRSKLQLSINRPNEKDYLPLLEVKAKPGEPFFLAGQAYEGGTLVVGVRVGATPEPHRPTQK